ncbi:hypothetical protein J1N35_029726 [Gossypium stocksii]|uniref:Uncharacterized protein n=1 Tax=Gossypium stocksii TaxID=47602 RepID=A0A9D3UZH5_9ROSI|nr:hypothetical protein J1N35_029726 [Gossypium stocksii]
MENPKSQNARGSVHQGAASHGSRRCALKHASLAATLAMGVCPLALLLTRKYALAMPSTRMASALESLLSIF